jgi:hypothetical protein
MSLVFTSSQPRVLFTSSVSQAVIINLSVSTELTEMFKLNWHVCEVQLLLRSFADLLVRLG